MNGRSNATSKIKTHPKYNKNTDSRIIEDISTLKLYDERKKISILNFFLGFSLFIFLIGILLISNNSYSFNSWNYKNYLDRTSYFENKRSLGECKNVREPRTELLKTGSADASKYSNQNLITEAPIKLEMKQRDYGKNEEDSLEEIVEKIDMDNEKNIDIKVQDKKIKFGDILAILKSNKRISSIIGIFFILIVALILFILNHILHNMSIYTNVDLNMLSVLLINIAIVLTSFFLIYK